MMDHNQILCSLRETGEHSDLTVICGSETFKVHKCVVCLRSKWFAAACQQGRWKEGKENVIELQAADSQGEDEDLSCDNPHAICLMIDFMYLGDYAPHSDPVTTYWYKQRTKRISPFGLFDEVEPCVLDDGPSGYTPPHLGNRAYIPPDVRKNKKPGRPKKSNFAQLGFATAEQPKGSLTTHTRLYALGLKYGVQDLSEVASMKLQDATGSTWDREDFAKAITIAFGATAESDQTMRTIIIDTILSCSAELAEEPCVVNAITSVDGLAFELFKRQSTGKGC